MSEKCKKYVWPKDSWHSRRCERNATTADGFCATHDPELRAARDKKRSDERQAKWARENDASWQRMEDQAVGRAVRLLLSGFPTVRFVKLSDGVGVAVLDARFDGATLIEAVQKALAAPTAGKEESK